LYSIKGINHQNILSNRLTLAAFRQELLHLGGLDDIPDQAVGEEAPGMLQTL
jgi:hypothetical protein